MHKPFKLIPPVLGLKENLVWRVVKTHSISAKTSDCGQTKGPNVLSENTSVSLKSAGRDEILRI